MLFVSRFNETYISRRFSKNTQISNFVKIRSVVTELFHVNIWMDEQKDRYDESHSISCNFAFGPDYQKLAKRYFSGLISRRCLFRSSTGTSAILTEVSLIFLSLQTGMVTDTRTSASKFLPLHR